MMLTFRLIRKSAFGQLVCSLVISLFPYNESKNSVMMMKQTGTVCLTLCGSGLRQQFVYNDASSVADCIDAEIESMFGFNGLFPYYCDNSVQSHY